MNGVRQSVCAQRRVFSYRARGFRTVGGNATGKDELPDGTAGAIDDAHRFHQARRAGHVDLPHVFYVENAGGLGIEDESQVDDGLRTGLAQQIDQLPAASLTAQVHLFKPEERRTFGWAPVYAHHAKVGQQRKQSGSQVPRYSRDQHRPFRWHDYFGGAPGLGGGALPLMGGPPGPPGRMMPGAGGGASGPK